MAAAYLVRIECMQLLLAAHDPAAQVMAVNKQGANALMIAAAMGKTKSVRLLLELPCAREQVEAVDRDGLNALMNACRGGHVPCVKLLLAACGGSLAAAQCQAATK
jgi:ankyrin repeat protein